MRVERPESMEEALKMLSVPGTKAIAGGTNVMVDIKKERETAECLVSLDRLSALKKIEIKDDGLHIGALVTFTELEDFLKNCVEEYPAWNGLLEAASLIGGPQIRNRGTVGGNILCASPSSDSVPALMVLDAKLILGTLAENAFDIRTKEVPLEGFVTGVRKTSLQQGELLMEIFVPKKTGVSCFYKVGARKAMAISIANQAMYLEMEQGNIVAAAIACGSVAPVVIRVPKTEALLCSGQVENIRESLMEEISPITDLRADKEYRELLSGNILEENLKRLMNK